VIRRVRTADGPAGLIRLSYGLGQELGERVSQRAADAVSTLDRWAWGFTSQGYRDNHLSAAINEDSLGIPAAHLGRREFRIVSDVVATCRAQLGMDRSSDPSDLATRALVKKTVWGLLTDTTQYPDLRKADASRLCPIASELALSPIEEELVALNVASSAPMARNRSLAAGSWGVRHTTWSGWMCALLGLGEEGRYLGPAPRPAF